MPILRIKNWSFYQHYKDRCPPWIKLHYSLLSSRDWVMLSDSDRVLAIASMLLASQSGMSNGEFNADPDYFKRVAYLSKKPNFKTLIDIGFLEHASDCKQMLAKDTTETETETEKRERQSRETAGAARTTGTRLPSDWQPSADELTFCIKERSDLDPQVTAERFRDYWIAQPGTKGRKLDWVATWRNWVRNEKKQNRARDVHEQNAQTLRELIGNA